MNDDVVITVNFDDEYFIAGFSAAATASITINYAAAIAVIYFLL